MGSGPSNVTAVATPPVGIRKINDDVWQLRDCDSDTPEVEIIFFHGLQLGDFGNAYWKTWLTRDGSEVWPQTWLNHGEPKARIWTVSYDAFSRYSLDMYVLGENLVSAIITSSMNIGQNCSVILVGHCLGGLVIKQFILSSFQKKRQYDNKRYQEKIQQIETFLRNIRGVFYYATPHEGAESETKIASLAGLIPKESSILKLLKNLDTDRARINEDFRQTRSNGILNAITCAVAEGLPTTYKGFNSVVVPEASARIDTDDFHTVRTDHFDVCKPNDMQDAIFIKLRDFIKDAKQLDENERLKVLNKFKERLQGDPSYRNLPASSSTLKPSIRAMKK